MNAVFESGNIIDNRYEVETEIGGGGFGKVLKVLDLNIGNKVALKYCHSEDQVDMQRFQREVRIMEGIEHENVVEIIDSNIDHNPPYFTMPLALYPISNIIGVIQSDTEKVIGVFDQICQGINAIHNSGHTHRDIKPENVLAYDNSRFVVSDLGLAKFNERDTSILTRASIYIGTQDYMPPEQMLYGGTRDADHRGDIYQLGKTFYELLTGLRPTVMNPAAVPIGFWYVIQKATRQNPIERYQSVGQLLDAIYDAKKAMDPTSNPLTYFDQLLTIAEEKLTKNEYEPENLTKLIQVIYGFEDSEDIVESLHKLPDRLINIYARDLSTEFEPLMKKYSIALEEVVGEYPFSFAEKVSAKMLNVFSFTESAELKRDAIIAVLFAAVKLNRFAAMSDFDNMLRSIQDDHTAFAVAESLREENYYYANMYDRIPRKELHPAIQTVWLYCDEQNKHDEL